MMSWIPHGLEKVVDTVGLVGFGMLSGWLGYLMRTLDKGHKIIWVRSFLEASASGVVGFLGIMMCRAMGLSFEWTGVVVGVFGWLGATVSISLFEKMIRRKLGIENVEQPSEISK